MVDIVTDIKNWLKTELPTVCESMTIDNNDNISSSLMIRGDPSGVPDVKYIDGSTTGSQQVTFYAKNDPATAKANLQTIYEKMNQPEITLTDVLCIRVFPASLPAFVSKEKTGESNYSFTVNIDFDNQTEIGV